MPPEKRNVAAKRGRPPLPEGIRNARKQVAIGFVDHEVWDRIQLAAKVRKMTIKQFVLDATLSSAEIALTQQNPE